MNREKCREEDKGEKKKGEKMGCIKQSLGKNRENK